MPKKILIIVHEFNAKISKLQLKNLKTKLAHFSSKIYTRE